MTELLRVENLHVSVGKKELLHGINLTVNKGEVHVIMGCLLYTSDAADD